jgi:antitoxin component YwqK of YwqJK toxin-antitoxin module|tara:strand:- start:476 stop:862 length:387 start_codon:yes stop_codon:yes gene_type:complete
MKDGFQTGVLENGMTLEVFYKDGLKHGKEVYKFASGSIASEANYLKGLLQGKLTEWDENGQIIQVINFKDNLEHGKATTWDENGQLASEIMMKEGRPKGKYIIYKNGIKAKEGIANYSKVDSPSCSCC